MNEKALFIIIFMYAMSFAFLGGQYIFGDAFGITMKSFFTNTPIQSSVLTITDVDIINEIADDVVNVNATTNSTITGIERSFTLGTRVAIQLFQLMTGTYVFNLLLLFDVPIVIITGMVIIYVFFLIRQAISIFRNG